MQRQIKVFKIKRDKTLGWLLPVDFDKHEHKICMLNTNGIIIKVSYKKEQLFFNTKDLDIIEYLKNIFPIEKFKDKYLDSEIDIYLMINKIEDKIEAFGLCAFFNEDWINPINFNGYFMDFIKIGQIEANSILEILKNNTNPEEAHIHFLIFEDEFTPIFSDENIQPVWEYC